MNATGTITMTMREVDRLVLVQISIASEKQRIRRRLIERKELPSK
jgi:hypothetical protein